MALHQPHLPTIKQLRYFVALCEEQHFGRAAARCFVSQSAFSIAIKEFEKLLGMTLIDRTNRQVTVTSAGKEIAVLARLCLNDLTALVESARERGEQLAGPLQLGIIPTIAPFLLPRMLPPLRRAYPKLKLYLQEDVTQRLHAQLLEGALDVVVLALPYELPGVEQKPLFRDRFLLAAREGTRLVDPERYSPKLLPDGSVLLLKEGHCLREHTVSACKIRNSEKMSHVSASSLLTLIEMVDADLGVTFLPEMAVGSAMLAGTSVKTYPLGEQSYREIGLMWRRGSARTEEFKILASFISKHRGG